MSFLKKEFKTQTSKTIITGFHNKCQMDIKWLKEAQRLNMTEESLQYMELILLLLYYIVVILHYSWSCSAVSK